MSEVACLRAIVLQGFHQFCKIFLFLNQPIVSNTTLVTGCGADVKVILSISEDPFIASANH
jgi:hypothetical protein